MSFRLEADTAHLRVVHWGRPINHRGAGAQHGLAKGYDRDLINMLVLNFSDKIEEDGTTGKHGLGFKPVHGLTDSVGIASGLIAIRTRGGMLPVDWRDGARAVERYGRDRIATLIDVPFASGRDHEGRKAVEEFKSSAPYLPLFAKAIRRIEIEDGSVLETHSVRAEVPVPGVSNVGCVRVEGPHGFSALRFALGEGYSLTAKVGETGLVPFADSVPRLWQLAPLVERLKSGWLLNGPFRLSPSRAELRGGQEAEMLFRRVARRLGEQFVALHSAAQADWAAFASTLGLSEDATRELFFKRLWALFRLDLDDERACQLHADGNGLAALAAARPAVVPSGLESPYDRFVCAAERMRQFDGALKDADLRVAIADWPGLTGLGGRFLDADHARDVTRLGFARPLSTTMEDVLRCEQKRVESRVDVDDARRLGAILTKSSIRQLPLQTEQQAILRCLRELHFRDSAGSWRPVSELTFGGTSDRAEELRAAFAPPERLLGKGYTGEALAFIDLAREQSGHSPTPEILRSWAESAQTTRARAAVLRFLVKEDKGDLGDKLRAQPPGWMKPLDEVAEGPLTQGWSQDEKNHLRAILSNFESVAPPSVPASDNPLERSDPETALARLWDWWAEDRNERIADYDRTVYPSSHFDRGRLHNPDDREAWFTLFALACFQNFGGAQDGQHRSFLEEGFQQGWWRELAFSSPPEDDAAVWINRMKAWSSAAMPDYSHWRWRRTLLDLYTIARWLPEYVRVIKLLPGPIRTHGVVRLSDVLSPSHSPIWQQAGIEAASLVRPLGIGFNWLLRELVRLEFWDTEARRLVAPYGWSATRRVRNLLNRLGAGLADEASMDGSRHIWDFVKKFVPERHQALSMADLDLPLQLITRSRNQEAYRSCFLAVPALAEDDIGESDGDDAEMEAAE